MPAKSSAANLISAHNQALTCAPAARSGVSGFFPSDDVAHEARCIQLPPWMQDTVIVLPAFP